MSIAQQSAALRMAAFRLTRRLRAQKGDDTVSDTQMTALMILSKHGALTLSALAEHDGVSAPSMNRTVNCLEDAGYVVREEDAGDRRKNNISLTASGTALVAATLSKRDAWLTERLRAATPAERAVLAQAAEIMARFAAR